MPVAEPATVRVACVQVNASEHMDANIAIAVQRVAEAAADGVSFVLFPENVGLMTWGHRAVVEAAAPEATHPVVKALKQAARNHGVWVLVGSVAVPSPDGRVCNRSILLNDHGEAVAHYDKIHLFDVDLGDGEVYRESKTFAPGDRAVVAPTPWGGLGMSVCYDLRFPHLYRALARAGAVMLTVPAAFTRRTGEAHWHSLLRARAIETGSYVLAPAQTGTHMRGRETYGHALMVDPWGAVVADAGAAPSMIVADLDLGKVAEARTRMPSLHHDRTFAAPESLA